MVDINLMQTRMNQKEANSMNEQSTTNQFTLYIPSEISSDSNLNLSEMRVLATIKALDNEKNCFATNSYIAECLALSVRQVSRVIGSLEKKGYIEIENKNSFKRKIKVAAVQEKEQQIVETNDSTPQSEEKVVPFNTTKPNTYKPQTKKVTKFNNIYSHDRDYDTLMQLENLKTILKIGQINEKQYKELANPLLNKMGMGYLVDEITG